MAESSDMDEWRAHWAALDAGQLYQLCAVAVGIDPTRIALKRRTGDPLNNFNLRSGLQSFFFEIDNSSLADAELATFRRALDLAMTAVKCGALVCVGVDPRRFDEFASIRTTTFGAWAVTKALLNGIPTEWSGRVAQSRSSASEVLDGWKEIRPAFAKRTGRDLSEKTLRALLENAGAVFQHRGREVRLEVGELERVIAKLTPTPG